jgi:hypothetical protein
MEMQIGFCLTIGTRVARPSVLLVVFTGSAGVQARFPAAPLTNSGQMLVV